MPRIEGRKGWERVERTWISHRARRSASSLAWMEVLSTTFRAKRVVFVVVVVVVGLWTRKTVPMAPFPRILSALRLSRSSSNGGGAGSILVSMEWEEGRE